MKKILFAACCSLIMVCPGHSANKDKCQPEYLNNRYPLLTKPYMELPIGAITPTGWLADQLVRMRDGMTGHLDEAYPQVMGPRNGWLGGDGDVWERGPYWIDGLLPLAYILKDKEMIQKVQPWIEWTLASQKENGYFGPDTDRDYEPGLQRDNSKDWWPKMVMLKVMQQYYMATQDPRVIDFFTNYFKYQLEQLPKDPLGKWTFWGEQRGGDNLLVVYWLYNITGDRFLLDLGELIHKQSFDWTDIFLNQNHLSRPNSLHCVNLAQGFKEPVVYYQQSKDSKHIDAVKKAVKTMRHTIGFPTGLWAGDELLQFGDPTQGSELCTAVEMMYSLEEMLKITGDVQWADHLERVAYNALPTQISDKGDARQYYQQVNQVTVVPAMRNFSTPHDDTDIQFGVLTGYPCCTSNLHQGWPKLVQNLWYASVDGGIAALVYAPSKATIKVAGDIPVNVTETTNYPFDETVNIKISFADKKIKSAVFPFHLRVPGWCQNPVVRVNGKEISPDTFAENILKVNREWKNNDEISILFPAEVKASRWFGNSAVIERGPLIYALKMNERWEKKETPANRKGYGDWYYEVTSDTPWNFGLPGNSLNDKNINKDFQVEKRAISDAYPWTVTHAPVIIKTKGREIPHWILYNNTSGPVNFLNQHNNDCGETRDIELIPYGCTTLRITEFPVR